MLTGARWATLMRAPSPHALLIFAFAHVVILLSFTAMKSFGASDTEILMKFKESLGNAKTLDNWDPNVSPCEGNRGRWVGVICFNGNIRGLQLENEGLTGTIDVDSLVSLRHLRTLSFMNNTLAGPMPNIKKLSALKSMYLSYNHFSGEIPDDAFEGMSYLKKVFLSHNGFTGRIPSSLTALPRLMVLTLDENKFEGQIPNFEQKNLKKFNVSNNNLEGPIPVSLSIMDSNCFSGNQYLCGPPLELCKNPRTKLPVSRFALIVVLAGLLIAVIIGVLFFIFYMKMQSSPLIERTSTSLKDQNKLNVASYRHQEVLVLEGRKPESSSTTGNTRKVEHATKLSFVRDDRERFDLHDLLRASAEILGSATYGSSYKARIMGGQSLVVKRCKQMNSVGREEFQEHMRRLGNLSHPNLLPLVAYYYRKEEKLLVSDFVENGSLAGALHGNHSEDKPALDWLTRLRIIKGVARGLAYLYDAIPTLVLPNGHLKSSNVLLDRSFNPVMTDYALAPVISLDLAQQTMIAYKSPEYAKHGRITKKTDVWSFGILILEILTGRFPENYIMQAHDRNADLAGWVNAMIKEKKTNEVFDSDMGGLKNSKSELLKLLKIGLNCCEEDEERRLDMKEAVERIEQLEGESAGAYASSVAINGGDVYSLGV
ncbi:pollen receptor-like kinase 4 [Carya illinoinensis]|uniref:non-specific serine/threonine protein kinase n=2 Tax=Carya illinoinensis TaxID=32201 RepID=A0A922K0K6_CARIL|nr:pollen receptor-like kinase 4 [Carya illinoinensis]KAG6727356.1 hypothetical protein I3842_02G125500 [Carya illinoinensis]